MPMKTSMLQTTHENQIGKPIVGFIPILVMYNLILFKRTSKFLFHFKAVFVNIATRLTADSLDAHIPRRRINMPASFPVRVITTNRERMRSIKTRFRTVQRFFITGEIFFPTCLTYLCILPTYPTIMIFTAFERSVIVRITIMRAIFGDAAWKGKKYLSALLTNPFYHSLIITKMCI